MDGGGRGRGGGGGQLDPGAGASLGVGAGDIIHRSSPHRPHPCPVGDETQCKVAAAAGRTGELYC